MPDVYVAAPGTVAAPLGYTVPGAQEIIIKALYAEFDGSGSASSFVPAIQLIAPGGKVAGTYIANGQVAAGASADTSWFPFVGAAGLGIQFDTDNEGGWLDVTTNDTDPSGSGIAFTDESGGGIFIYEPSGGGIVIRNGQVGGLTLLETGPNGLTARSTSAGPVTVSSHNGNTVVNSDNGEVQLRSPNINALGALVELAGTTSIRLAPATGAGQFFADAGIWFLDARPQTSFGIRFAVGTGSFFEVLDNSLDPLFRVNQNGDLQGKTGKALTFNL